MEAVLQQVLTKLNELQAEINNMKQTVATKQDLENMVTKEDLKAMAAKQDLENMATKEDLKAMATKQDLENMATKEDLKAMATKQDLENMATKEDLKAMATKQDLENMATKEDLKAMATKQDLKMIQQAVLETNEIVKNIEANQKRQERILDVLSKRSIEHEAQITDLRYVK
nr:repeat-containing protein [Anoxybacillus gonensis]